MILPHGGELINRVVPEREKLKIVEDVKKLPSLQVDTDSLLDIENIAVGTFSPLKGFMTKEELLSVAHNMTLPNGIVWTIPILLQLREEPKIGGRIAIKDGKGKVKAVLDVKEVYKIDLKKIARLVCGQRAMTIRE